MNDRVIGKYLNRLDNENGEVVAKDSDVEDGEDFGAFGMLRGGQRDRCLMLELRKKSGDTLAIGYGWIERMEYIPGNITLYVAGQQISIRGRNLNGEGFIRASLFRCLTRHRACWIKEQHNSIVIQTDEKRAKVESIDW